MPETHGIYDDVCAQVREQTQAVGVAVLILGGSLGSGFSVVTKDLNLNNDLPDILEDMAKQIREKGFDTTKDQA
jgi:hypothetical protein